MPSMEKKKIHTTNGEITEEEEQVRNGRNLNGFHSGNGESSIAISPDADVASASEDFFDPHDLMSVEADDHSLKLGTPRAEFFDAPEDVFDEFSSECGTQISLRHVEADELHEEMERRKKAEETLDIMQRQWQRLAQRLSLEGLTLPAASTLATEDETQNFDPAGELCHQISLARAVSTSIGMEAAKAVAEMELKSQIESKNFELARLQQRLHYYEAVSSEMSLRNQEAVEMARSPWQRNKRWIWSSIGVSIIVGSMALAWSFLITARGSPPTDNCGPEGEGAANELPN